MTAVKSIEWIDGTLRILDQTLLPTKVEYIDCNTAEDVAAAVRDMKVRGAPAIGASAAYAMALAARQIVKDTDSRPVNSDDFISRLDYYADILKKARPTAVNLRWAVDRMMNKAQDILGVGIDGINNGMINEAYAIAAEDKAANMRIGEYGASLIKDGAVILTHCNTGSLATVDYGTALGVIRAASGSGKRIKVFADETRPFLQGARLTAYELMEEGIDTTLIVDSTAGYLMKLGKIDAVIVGADRIAANGDVANKIGTYTVSTLARYHGIPFYVAAPVSTIDLTLSSGDKIPIEERSPEEVTTIMGHRFAPEGVNVFNPSFDVTPGELVSAIITEKGIIRPPYTRNLKLVEEMQ